MENGHIVRGNGYKGYGSYFWAMTVNAWKKAFEITQCDLCEYGDRRENKK